MADAAGIQVVIDDGDEPNVRVDDVTGTIETTQPDGGVVVQLDAKRKKADGEPDDFYRNLVGDIGAGTLGRIASELHDGISADDRSRGNYLEILQRGYDFLGIEIKEPRASAGDTSAAVEGQATVTNPLLLEALLKAWANAQAELLPAEGPAKVADDSDDPSAQRDELADSLERDINHYLTVTAKEYVPDTSHMLLWGTHFAGSGIKKVYRCPLRRRPVSESVALDDLIVSNTVKDLRASARITHQISMRPSVMKRMLAVGAYKTDKTLTPATPTNDGLDAKIASIQGTDPTAQRTEDRPYILWESQCELDLPDYAPAKFRDEGIPLPYLVTIDKESREILAVRRDWNEDDEECERKRLYVRYPYVPGPGFYGTGLLQILGNASAAMTAAWRLSLDSAMFANFPAGLIAKLGGRQNTSDIRLGPGTWQGIETNGQPIGNIVAPNPYKDVSAGMLTLIDKITQQAQGLGGAADVPTAEGVQNVPVGTMLAQIEQATKIMAAAHKGMHYAQAEEIRMIVDLFREHPEDFWKANKVAPPDYWTEEKFIQAINDYELVPASDPNTPSHIFRVAKALGLFQLFQSPVFAPKLNADEALNRILRAMREDPKGLVLPPQPASPMPDPNMIVAAAKKTSADAAMLNAQSKAADLNQDASVQAAKLQTEKDIATVDLAKEMVIHRSDQAAATRAAATQAAEANRSHALDVGKAVHDASMDHAQHGLDVAQHLHDRQMDITQAMQPQEPKTS